MLNLIDSIEKDKQCYEGRMATILLQIRTLKAEYKMLERYRENAIYAIDQLEEQMNG
jgi:hypothetical protein